MPAAKPPATGECHVVPMISLVGGKRLRQAIDRSIVAGCGRHVDIEVWWKDYFCRASPDRHQ